MQDTYIISTTLTHPRTFHVATFSTRGIHAKSLERVNLCEIMQWHKTTAKIRQKITAKISHPRTFYIEVFYKSRTPEGQLRESETASVDWKCHCGTSLNAWRRNGRDLRYIDNNYTWTHNLTRIILLWWYTRKNSLERVKVCTSWQKIRVWDIANCKRMQWKKPTWYWQKSQMRALFTKKCFTCVESQGDELREG